MEQIQNYYDLLGVTPQATIEEIKQAYLDLVTIWRPDKYSHDPRLYRKAADKIRDIDLAYQKLMSILNGETANDLGRVISSDNTVREERKQITKARLQERHEEEKKDTFNKTAHIWTIISVFSAVFIGVLLLISNDSIIRNYFQSKHNERSFSQSTLFVGDESSKLKKIEGPSRQYYDTLSALVPSWETMKEHPQFFDWSIERDIKYGNPRFLVLMEAEDTDDAHKAAHIYRSFKHEVLSGSK